MTDVQIRNTAPGRERWVDAVKIFACILVALGHFFQSMVRSGILSEGSVYSWFNQTIYCFHVPLFFICSGYLYQKGSPVNTFAAWKGHVKKKLVTLGIPYLAFSFVTWVLKAVFSSSVNNAANGLFHDLFVEPQSPYWYLMILFCLFALIPTFSGKRAAVAGICVAGAAKAAVMLLGAPDCYLAAKSMENGIWFVLGMGLQLWDRHTRIRKKTLAAAGAALSAAFVAMSIYAARQPVLNSGMNFLMGLIACTAVIALAIVLQEKYDGLRMWDRLTEYTMPVFLMHTIFAAGLRSVLMKLGIFSPAVHIAAGLLISFAGPIAAAEIMKKVKWLDIFLRPGRYIRLSR